MICGLGTTTLWLRLALFTDTRLCQLCATFLSHGSSTTGLRKNKKCSGTRRTIYLDDTVLFAQRTHVWNNGISLDSPWQEASTKKAAQHAKEVRWFGSDNCRHEPHSHLMHWCHWQEALDESWETTLVMHSGSV